MVFKKCFIIVFIFSVLRIYSQLDAADILYNRAQYVKAVPVYEKLIKDPSISKKDKQDALIRLGNCYRKLNQTDKAISSYSEALTIKSKNAPTADLYYNYAQVLRAKAKYPEAAEQYNNVVQINPNDVNAKNCMKFCLDIKKELTKANEYTVKKVPTINTKLSEFAACIDGNHLIFSAERDAFDFSEFVINDFDGAPFFHLYRVKMNGEELEKEREMPMSINTDFYDGPCCVTADGKTLYFSRVSVSKKEGVVNQAQIYSASRVGNRWANVQLVNVSGEDYSVTHPSISADGNTLYFTSNMAGGLGGKDIYMSRKSGITWTKPVNLGPEINTKGDEMYPSIRNDGVLFFASNGLPGYGGLDIYSAAKKDNNWLVKNEGMLLNSNADDFGMAFLNDSSGYFSSNREGGRGKEDIYFYKYRSKAMNIDGRLLLTQNIDDPAKRTRILLSDPYGNFVDSILTDENGAFLFKNLNSELKYMAVLHEDDPVLVRKARYFLATKEGVIMMVSGKNGRERFTFKNLPIEKNSLPDLNADAEMSMTLAGNLLYQEKGSSKPIRNVRLSIVNSFGDVTESVITNEFGAFVFRNIPVDQNYIISLEEADISLPAGTRVFLTNKNGKELMSQIIGKEKLGFKIIQADKTLLKDMEIEDVEISGVLSKKFTGNLTFQEKGNNKPLKNVHVSIINLAGEITETALTNEQGVFVFRKIPIDQNYIISIDEGDISLPPGTRVSLTSKSGKELKSLVIGQEELGFNIIQTEKNLLNDMILEDLEISPAMSKKFSGNLLYQEKGNNKPVKNTHLSIVNQSGDVIEWVVTNEFGAFVFKNIPSDQNYLISIEEADITLPPGTRVFLTNNSGKELKSIVVGKDKLGFNIIQADKNLLKDMNLEDIAMSAVLSKKFSGNLLYQEKGNNKPVKNTHLSIVNQAGDVIERVVTNEFGAFVFRNIPSDQNYLISIEEADISLPPGTRVFLTNNTGKELKSIVVGKDKLGFNIIQADKNLLKDMNLEDIKMSAAVLKKFSGNLLYQEKGNNKPVKNIHLSIVNLAGEVLERVVTNEFGAFVFKNIPSDQNYLISIEEADITLPSGTRVFLTNNTGKELKSIVVGKEKLAFNIIQADKNLLKDMNLEDIKMSAGELKMFSGNLLYSEKGLNKPVKNTHLSIVNSAGEVIEQAVSNENGAFVFRKIPSDKNFLISIDEGDIKLPNGTRVYLTNKNGKILKSTVIGGSKFAFNMIQADKNLLKEMNVEDAELLMTITGYLYDQDRAPLASKKIQVREEGSNNVYEWITNAVGQFKFKNLKADKNYLLESTGDDPTFGGLQRIYVGDKNGNIYKVLELAEGKFKFKIIEADKHAMGEFIVDDPWLKLSDSKGTNGQENTAVTIVERILYGSGDYQPDAAGQTILDKVSEVLLSNPKLKVEIVSHTDSRSSDAFNLELSKKRAQTAVDYIVTKGIDVQRLKATGLGETKLLNRCANGVDCSDEEHKVNRRTEFKVTVMPKI
jgi:outer membrane protein OmpA-like peptidoglycan-associated protein